MAARDVATLVHAIDIRVKSEALARIEADTDVHPPAPCAASVIVCTNRFGPRVVATLRSVLRQDFDRPWELIVVNNAPTRTDLSDTVAALRAELPADHPARVRLVICPIVGLSAARNAGLAEASGDTVCFLDDDAVADEGWLALLWEAFEAHPNAGVIGGHISLAIPEPRPRALRPGWEKYWSHFVTGFTDYTEVEHWWEFPWGANWAARRRALLLAGGFRSRYGRVGDNAWGGEELVAAAVVRRLGYAIAVLPQATVVHDVDPSRFTFLHVLRTLVAGHQVAYLAQRDLYVPRESRLRTTLWQLCTQHVDTSLPSHEQRWRNVAYRKYAQLRLLAAQFGDLRRRFRRPVVVSEPRGRA
jgi:GT2 family glycosyltransferase